jgi:hypothetical protein
LKSSESSSRETAKALASTPCFLQAATIAVKTLSLLSRTRIKSSSTVVIVSPMSTWSGSTLTELSPET